MSVNTEALTLCGRTFEPTRGVSQFLAPEPTGGLRVQRAVLFSDIIGSTSYFERFGDEAGVAMLALHHDAALPVMQKHGGRLVKKIGDALMVAFETPDQAIQAAIETQRILANLKDLRTGEPCLERIGIGYGSVFEQDGDLFGDVVNTAARIENMGEGGQILCSAAAYEALDYRLDCPVRLFDAVPVRGHVQSIDIFEICWDGQASRRDVNRAAIGGRFELCGLLGEGGMGQVYRALDRALNEEVALKFVRADLASSKDALEQFKAEVRLSRSLTHRNVCRIYEFLEMEGRVFLSMELVRGKTLAEVIAKEAPMPPARACEICKGICRGLQAAHRCGIVHRDLKPGNVMIEEQTNRVVVMDFGIAMLVQTETGNVVQGTPEYMAPEQALGKPQTQRTDIYALGAVMYEMLTGRPPIVRGDPIETAAAQVTTRAQPLCSQRPDVSRKLGLIVDRCLQKDPEKRFKDAETVRRAIEAIEKPPVKSTRLLVALALLSVCLAVGAYLFLKKQHSLELGPIEALVRTDAFERYGVDAPNQKYLAFLRDRSLVISNPELGEFPVQNLVVREDGPLAGVAWDSTGERLFVATADGAIELLSSRGGERLARIQQAGAPALSPDGHSLVFLRPDELDRPSVMMVDLQDPGRHIKTLLQATADRAYFSPRFSADGRRLLISVVYNYDVQSRARIWDRVLQKSDLGLLDLQSGAFQMLTRDAAGYLDPLFAPDGESIFYVSESEGPRALFLLNPLGQKQLLYQHPQMSLAHPSLGSGRLVIGLEETITHVALLKHQSDRELTLSASTDNDVRVPRFGSDGNQVFYLKGKAERPQLELLQLDSSFKRYLQAPAHMRQFVPCGQNRILLIRQKGENMVLGFFDLEQALRHQEVIDWADSEKLTAGAVTDLFTSKRLSSPICAKDGDSLIAFIALQGDEPPRLWMYKDRNFEAISSVKERVLSACISNDGKKLAWRAESIGEYPEESIYLLDLNSRVLKTFPLPQSAKRFFGRMLFSPDNQSVDLLEPGNPQSILWRFPLREGAKLERLEHLPQIYDWDRSPESGDLIYPRTRKLGDLYQSKIVY